MCRTPNLTEWVQLWSDTAATSDSDGVPFVEPKLSSTKVRQTLSNLTLLPHQTKTAVPNWFRHTVHNSSVRFGTWLERRLNQTLDGYGVHTATVKFSLVPTTNLTSTHEFSAAGGKYVGAVWTTPKSFDLLIKFISNFRGKKKFYIRTFTYCAHRQRYYIYYRKKFYWIEKICLSRLIVIFIWNERDAKSLF